ncbi:MAG: diguanylate cyclase domain-containing protein, partial [Acidimicrobiales bacterium]
MTGIIRRISGQTQAPPIPRQAKIFIACLALPAVGLALAVASGARPAHPHGSIPWPLIAVALLGAEMVPVRFHTERDSVSVDLFDLPMLLGAVFTGSEGLLLATVLATLARTTMLRQPPFQALFNVANQVVGVSLALLVLHAALGGSSPVRPLGWLGLFLALLAYDLANYAGIYVVMALSTGSPRRSYLRSVGLHLVLVFPLSACAGIVAVTVMWTDPWTMIVLVGLGLGLAMGYRAAGKLRARHDSLQLLYSFTVGLAGLTEREDVLTSALREARSMLSCHRVELCIPVRDGGVRYSLDAKGRLTRRALALVEFEADVATGGKSLLIPQRKRESGRPSRGFSDLMAVPIRLGEGPAGVMVLADSQGTSASFDPESLRLFEAIVAHLSTALTSSRRLDHLRREVAAREHQALHDELTGLANRNRFTGHLREALDKRHPSEMLAVMLMDLDGFKEINDTLGHHTGDDILKRTAQRVQSVVGPSQ